jgi:hypothetical protein
MKIQFSRRGGDVWSPIATKNSPGEWLAAILFAAGSCAFVMAYHDWWRAKTYSVLTLNESVAHTAYYCIALAFAFGPLYRFGLLPARAVMVRRTFGIVGVVCALLHVLLTLLPLWGKYGWEYLAIKHWDLTALGVANLVLAVWLLKTSLGNSVQRLGADRWFRLQLTGLALLPLALAHFIVLGKVAKWADWFAGRDKLPAPPGTFVIFCVGALVIALRVVDALCHVKIHMVPQKKN